MTQSEEFGKIESHLSLPSGYIDSLSQEDDWGYVIKVHALFEALLTQLLVERIGKPCLKNDLYKLPMNGRGSKVSFLLSLNTFENQHKKNIKKFIQGLSEIRNDIVHHAENLNFNFEIYYANLSTEAEKNNFKNGVCYFSNQALKSMDGEIDVEGVKVPLELVAKAAFENDIRRWVELTVNCVLYILALYIENSSLVNDVNELAYKFGRVIIDSKKKS